MILNVKLLKFIPTWNNSRIGDVEVAKSLDRFLIVENSVLVVGNFHAWVEVDFLLDHFPFCL